MRTDKAYLGDGLYAAWDGEHVILTAERDSATHEVFLNAEVWAELVDYIDRLRAKAAASGKCPICGGAHTHCSIGCASCDDPQNPTPTYAVDWCRACRKSFCAEHIARADHKCNGRPN